MRGKCRGYVASCHAVRRKSVQHHDRLANPDPLHRKLDAIPPGTVCRVKPAMVPVMVLPTAAKAGALACTAVGAVRRVPSAADVANESPSCRTIPALGRTVQVVAVVAPGAQQSVAWLRFLPTRDAGQRRWRDRPDRRGRLAGSSADHADHLAGRPQPQRLNQLARQDRSAGGIARDQAAGL